MWFVYVMLCRRNTLYTGITNDLEKRFKAHKEGKGGRYTRSHTPLAILYRQSYRTRSRALQREAEIKKWRRKEKLKLIKGNKS